MSLNEKKLETFEQSLDKRLPQMKREYVRAVNRDLTRQNWSGTFGRNITLVLDDNLKNVSGELAQIALIPEIKDRAHEMVLDFARVFVQSALQHNRTTCALSNFTTEHQPDAQYLRDVIYKVEHSINGFFV